MINESTSKLNKFKLISFVQLLSYKQLVPYQFKLE